MPKAPAPKKTKTNWLLWGRIFFWSGVFVSLAWAGNKAHTFLNADPRFEFNCPSERTSCASLEVHGLVYTKRARVQAVFADDFGKSIFRIPIEARWRRLLAIDWVKSASVSRVWPNRIVITITERKPVAFAKLPLTLTSASGGRHFMALIDQEGVLMTLPPKVRFHLPVLSGVNEDQPEKERKLRVDAMQHLLEDLGPEAKDVSEVNATNTQDLRVTTEVEGQGVELWLGDQHYRSRFTNFVNHYPDIRAHSGDAGVFDLRLDDRILAR